MNEEEFLKEHPSLKGKSVWTSIDESDSARFSGKDIHETQIDKQRVKEAIAKAVLGVHFEGYDNNSEKALIKMQEYIHKELKLDEP